MITLSAVTGTARAATETVIFTFSQKTTGSYPGPLLAGKSGTLAGTAGGGGGHGGVFYTLAPPTSGGTWHYKAILQFGSKVGTQPYGSLVRIGAFYYGVTEHGGAAGGGGVIYKLSPSGTISDIYTFPKGYAGGMPECLAADKAGNLYGVTEPQEQTGAVNIVFKLTKAGVFSTLATFPSGAYAAPSILVESDGTVVGTTYGGGSASDGSVYTITPGGVFSTLYSFPGGADGVDAAGPLAVDEAGNFYGVTEGGGISNQGVVFKLSPDGQETVLYSFLGGNDGRFASAGVVRDAAGNLYGTTNAGGTAGDGTVFMVTPDGTETVLHSFTNGTDGYFPQNPVVLGQSGTLFGTTAFGGSNGGGVVYEITQ